MSVHEYYVFQEANSFPRAKHVCKTVSFNEEQMLSKDKYFLQHMQSWQLENTGIVNCCLYLVGTRSLTPTYPHL